MGDIMKEKEMFKHIDKLHELAELAFESAAALAMAVNELENSYSLSLHNKKKKAKK